MIVECNHNKAWVNSNKVTAVLIKPDNTVCIYAGNNEYLYKECTTDNQARIEADNLTSKIQLRNGTTSSHFLQSTDKNVMIRIIDIDAIVLTENKYIWAKAGKQVLCLTSPLTAPSAYHFKAEVARIKHEIQLHWSD